MMIAPEELFFKEQMRRKHERGAAAPENEKDPLARLYGSAMPNDIPESCAWLRA